MEQFALLESSFLLTCCGPFFQYNDTSTTKPNLPPIEPKPNIFDYIKDGIFFNKTNDSYDDSASISTDTNLNETLNFDYTKGQLNKPEFQPQISNPNSKQSTSNSSEPGTLVELSGNIIRLSNFDSVKVIHITDTETDKLPNAFRINFDKVSDSNNPNLKEALIIKVSNKDNRLFKNGASIDIANLENNLNKSKDELKSNSSSLRPITWWQKSIVYQIYPRSLHDVNNNGTGTIQGIIAKADYFQELGIGAIWLSPIFSSPMADFGYDVSNFTSIDPLFGTMDDFDNLLKEMHARDIHVVLDFIPNHSSDEHEWFQSSVRKEEPYTDYYIWSPANGTAEDGTPIPPNNWLSVFGGSAWTWSAERKQFYLHQFLEKQPDLNFRNPAVVIEMNNVIRFWLDRGVDGLRIDAIAHLFEIEDLFVDEPLSDNPEIDDPDQYEYLNHTLTVNQPEIFQIIQGWRDIFDQYPDRLMMTEAYGEVEDIMNYYGNETDPLVDLPSNFNLITNLKNRTHFTGTTIKSIIDQWLDNMPPGAWPNWVLGNHDNSRVATRLGDDLVDALNILILLLPGTPITYYGEEIGMTDMYISFEETQDPFGCNFGPERYQEFSRDPERTPMQWDDTTSAGFSSNNSTWLPVNPNSEIINVKTQQAADQSHLKVYKALARLRQDETFLRGEISFPVITEQIFSFVRSLGNNPSYLVVINTSPEATVVNLHHNNNFRLPGTAEVVIRSSSDNSTVNIPGSEVDLTSVQLEEGGALVMQLPYQVSDLQEN